MKQILSKKPKFTNGSKVKATNNSVWGKVAMKVTDDRGDIIICMHPSFGSGGFYINELKKVTKKAAK